MLKYFMFLSLFIPNIAFTKSTVVDDEVSKLAAKAVMDGVYESFQKVIPYVYSDSDTLDLLKKDPKKKEELLKNLNDLSTFFKSARHVEYFQRPGFKPNLESMNSHLNDTINSVSNNNYAFAQKRLSALTTLCISCHTQLSASGARNAFGEAINNSTRKEFESDYAFGNYLYLIRNFEESEKFLVLSIEDSLNKSKTAELHSSLKRVISMHTKVSFNFKLADSFISKYKDDKRMPIFAKNMLTAWSKSLEGWRDFNPKNMNSISEFIKKYLSPLEEIREQTGNGDNDIALLISSGVLSKYLNDFPTSKDTPEILYWLSVAEKRLGTAYFFTISELYLKDCITQFKSSPFAKKCYELYEENVEFGYTGSGGTDVPTEEKRELQRLKKLLK
ncbi:MAG: hypothetical protein K2Q18_12615 [Bdellovibrionales bacterium]|nr:hypothetical protein [Bdellovibrionales bacterium]